MTFDCNTRWHNGLIEIVTAARESGFVIYGTGEYGKLAYDIFSLWNVKPFCFADDSDIYKHECVTIINDIPVITLEEAVKNYPDAVFISADDHQYKKVEGLNDAVTFKNDNLTKLGVCGKYSRFQAVRYKFLVLYAREKNLKTFDEIVEQLQSIDLGEDAFEGEQIDSVIFQSFVNVSGSLMFAQLCDGHPQILSLPLILGDAERFEIGLVTAFQNRLCNLSGLELAIEIMAQIPFLVKGCQKIEWFLDAAGNSVSAGIQLSAVSLFNKLYLQIRNMVSMSFGDIFKAIHCAYANASGKQKKAGLKYYIFYHLHAWGFRALYWKDFFKEVYYLDTIREPVRSAFSLLKEQLPVIESGYRVGEEGIDNGILYDSMYWLMKQKDGFYHHIYLSNDRNCKGGCIDVPTNLRADASVDAKIDYLVDFTLDAARQAYIYFIRFEDLKLRLEETMRSVCELLQIGFDPVMLETTANGNKIFESTQYTSSAGSASSVDQKDMRSLQPVDYSKYMNEYDIERTRMMFKRIAKYFGYGEYPGKDVSELSDTERTELLTVPCRLQSDYCPDNKYLTPFLVAYNLASSAVVTALVEDLKKQGKEYLIKPKRKEEEECFTG